MKDNKISTNSTNSNSSNNPLDIKNGVLNPDTNIDDIGVAGNVHSNPELLI